VLNASAVAIRVTSGCRHADVSLGNRRDIGASGSQLRGDHPCGRWAWISVANDGRPTSLNARGLPINLKGIRAAIESVQCHMAGPIMVGRGIAVRARHSFAKRRDLDERV